MLNRTKELIRLAVLIETTKIRLQRAIVTRNASLESRSSILLLTLHAQFYACARSTIAVDAALESITLVFSDENSDGVVIDSQSEAA
jgi:hypothetical protein